MISDLIYYLLPVLLILIPAVFHLRSKKKTSEIHHAVLKEAQESGLTEPPSLQTETSLRRRRTTLRLRPNPSLET